MKQLGTSSLGQSASYETSRGSIFDRYDEEVASRSTPTRKTVRPRAFRDAGYLKKRGYRDFTQYPDRRGDTLDEVRTKVSDHLLVVNHIDKYSYKEDV